MIAGKILKKQAKKAVFRHFLDTFDAPPSKVVHFGTKGAFRKTLGSVRQKGISQNSTKGGPFESAWGRIRIPEGAGSLS